MPDKRYQFFTPSTNRLLVIVLFLALLAAAVWLFSGVPRPREGDRVSAQNRSFTMIHPPDWDVEQKSGDARSTYVTAVTTSPKKSIGREIRLFMGEYKTPLDPPTLAAGGYKPITFQGQAALAREIQNKHDYTYMLVFERAGQSFEISIRLPMQDDVPHSEWWPYFESFRVTPRPASRSATLPG